MNQKKYLELLKNPLWFKKRAKIITRDGGKCSVCGSRKNLCVHHTFYFRQPTKPWQYPDYSLLTLCEKCHYDWHIHHELVFKDKPKKKKNIILRGKKKKKKKEFTLKELKMFEQGYKLGDAGIWEKKRKS